MEAQPHDPPRVVVIDVDRRVLVSHELMCYEDILDSNECVLTIADLLRTVESVKDASNKYMLIHDQNGRRWENNWEIPSLNYDHTVFRMIPYNDYKANHLPETDLEYMSNAARIMKRSWCSHRKPSYFDEKTK